MIDIKPNRQCEEAKAKCLRVHMVLLENFTQFMVTGSSDLHCGSNSNR